MTGSYVSHVTGRGPEQEVGFAHAQPEVVQYPLLLTGSDVSHVTGRGPVRKGSCAHAQPLPAFFLLIVVQVPWIPKVTRRVCACATDCSATVSRVFLTMVVGVFSTTSESVELVVTLYHWNVSNVEWEK